MICKINTISHTKNSLNYCEKGGELIHSNYVMGTAEEINKDMLELQNRNSRTEKKGIHAIISFNPEDDLTDYTHFDYSDIAEKYAEKHGFNENQYAVYLHEDKQHKHLHIVANRIGYDNKCVSSSHSYAKNTEFSKSMEQEYNLVRTNRKPSYKDLQEDYSFNVAGEFISEDKRLLKVKDKIDKLLPRCDNFKELEQQLKVFGVKTYRGRGVSFVDSSGAKFKGSQLGREYSLKGLEKQISNNQTWGADIEQSRNHEETSKEIEEANNTSSNDLEGQTSSYETNHSEVQQISEGTNIGGLLSKKDEDDLPLRKKRKRGKPRGM